jgi:hypothetical protein
MGPYRDGSNQRSYRNDALASRDNIQMNLVQLSSTGHILENGLTLRKDLLQNSSMVHSDSVDSQSNDSKRRIIMKQVQWTVDSDGSSSRQIAGPHSQFNKKSR